MCIVIICLPVYDVIIFENNFEFLIKPFFYVAKSQDKNVHLKNKTSFYGEIKSIFHHF